MKKKWIPASLLALLVLVSCGGNSRESTNGSVVSQTEPAKTQQGEASSVEISSVEMGNYSIVEESGLPVLVYQGAQKKVYPFVVEGGALRTDESTLNEGERKAFEDYFGSLTSIAFPETYRGSTYNVIYNVMPMPNLLTLSLPKNLCGFLEGAFASCVKLDTLRYDLEEYTFWEWPYQAFSHCPVRHLVIGRNVRAFPRELCNQMGWLVNSDNPNSYNGIESVEVEPGSKLESIADYAFSGLRITEFNLPSSVKSIGAGAFYNIAGIDSFFLPKSIETIGRAAFSKWAVIFTDAPERPSGWDEDFAIGPVIYGKSSFDYQIESMGLGFEIHNGEATLVRCDLHHETVEIPSSIEIDGIAYPVATIGPYAFAFPDYQEQAEMRDIKLRNITFAEGITTLGDHCFDLISCTYFSEKIQVYLPLSAVNFGERAIYSDRVEVYTPHDKGFMDPLYESGRVYGGIYCNVYSLPFELSNYTFVLCQGGAKLMGLSSSEGPIILPETVFYKGEEYPLVAIREWLSFGSRCVYLPASLLSIESVSAYKFVFPEGSKLQRLKLSNAFIEGEENLTELESIEGYCINGENKSALDLSRCKKLVSIGEEAFLNHTFTDIYLPSSLRSIGQNAFAGYYFLTIHIPSVNVPASLFSSIYNKDAVTFVADSGHEVYKENGMTFLLQEGEATLIDYTGSEETLKIPDAIVIDEVSYPIVAISCAAFSASYDNESQSYGLLASPTWNDTVKKLVIGKNVTSIGDAFFSAFKALENLELEDARILSYVGYDAFPKEANFFVGSVEKAAELTTTPSKMYLVSGTLRADTLSEELAGNVKYLYLCPKCKVSSGALTRFVKLQQLHLEVSSGYQGSLFNGLFSESEFTGSVAISQHLAASNGQLYENTVTTYAPSSLKKVDAFFFSMPYGFFNYVTCLNELSLSADEYMSLYKANAFRNLSVRKLSVDGRSVGDTVFASDLSAAFLDASIAELELRGDVLNFPLSVFAIDAIEKIHLDKPEGYENPVFIATMSVLSNPSIRAIHVDFDTEGWQERLAAALKNGMIRTDFFSGPIELAEVIDECEAEGVSVTEYTI